MSYAVRYSDPDKTAAAGFGKVAKLPFILDSRPGYHRLGSRYLIDRALGYWCPKLATGMQGQRGRRLSSQSAYNYAMWLANFLDWCEQRTCSLEACDYNDDILDGYQKEMLEGTWSSNERTKLKPKTVNARVQQACDFLTWMAVKGYREHFFVPTKTTSVRTPSATSSVGHRSAQIEVREGKVREEKTDLFMPTDGQVKLWLESVGEFSGATLQLVCETVLLTALRLSEVVGLRTDTLPRAAHDWIISNPDAPKHLQEVRVNIQYGTKGPEYGWDHGDKIGPSRPIRIPLLLAKKWANYFKRERHLALSKWVGQADSKVAKEARIKDAVHLFLNEKTGRRLTQDNVYRAWKSANLPYKEWRPHFGRDWWACHTLLDELSKIEVLKKLGSAAAIQLVRDLSLAIIDLRIKPQLGHADKRTTERYVVWVANQFGTPVSIEYDASLQADEHDDR